MKRLFVLFLIITMTATHIAFAADEYSETANTDYGYNADYDKTEKQEEITTNRSDGINTSYDEDYDEGGNQGVTSEIYDNSKQSYNEEFDERKTNTMISVSEGIKVFLNGKQLEFDVPPMLINNRTMVPMRVIFEALGADVDWDGSTQTAIGTTEKTTIKITIGKDYLLKNDNIVVLDSPAVVIDGRTLVPARAIAECLDCKVEWYGETQVVEILK